MLVCLLKENFLNAIQWEMYIKVAGPNLKLMPCWIQVASLISRWPFIFFLMPFLNFVPLRYLYKKIVKRSRKAWPRNYLISFSFAPRKRFIFPLSKTAFLFFAFPLASMEVCPWTLNFCCDKESMKEIMYLGIIKNWLEWLIIHIYFFSVMTPLVL